MIVAIWFAALGDVPLLNKVIDKLSHLRLAGYGLDITDLEQRRVTVALVGSMMGAYLTTSFFAIGWMDGSMKALKAFFAFTGCLLGIVFCGLWVKFLGDDHLLTTSDKMELFGLSMFLGLGSIALSWLGFRNRSSRSFAKAAATSGPPFIGSETAPESTDETNIPSVETLLENESSSENEGEEEASQADEPPSILAGEADMPAKESEAGEEVAQIEDPGEGPPELPEADEPPSVPTGEADPIGEADMPAEEPEAEEGVAQAKDSGEGPPELPEADEPPSVLAGEADLPAKESEAGEEVAQAEDPGEGPPELPEADEPPSVPSAEAGSEAPSLLPASGENVPPAFPAAESQVSGDETPPPLPPTDDSGETTKTTDQPA